MRKRPRSRRSEVRTLDDHGDQHGHGAQEKRRDHEPIQQHKGGVGNLSQGATLGRVDLSVVHFGPLPGGRSAPALAFRHRLSGVQRGGMAELRAVTQRGSDFEHCPLTYKRIFPDGNRACINHPVVSAVAGEERILANDSVVTDRQQVGAHGDLRG